jgi:small subunit ribosomal protein S6e
MPPVFCSGICLSWLKGSFWNHTVAAGMSFWRSCTMFCQFRAAALYMDNVFSSFPFRFGFILQINIACPSTGMQKVIEIDDEKRLQNLYERRMAQEIEGSILGEEFDGYIFRISGGNDKQGFAMRQGILTNSRVRLLMEKGHKGYRPRRKGERKRKSIRGCIVGHDISVLNLVVTQIGANTVEGLTNDAIPRRLGPKRANNIRKLFNLTKDDDVRKYVISRTFTNKKGKTVRKAPKIQRLVTPLTLQRKRARKAEKMNSVLRNKEEAAAYKKLVAQRLAEKREARRSLISKRRSSRKSAKMAAEQGKK